MNLLEILNSKTLVNWRHSTNEHRGVFMFDQQKITIHLDEYEYEDKLLIDFGFDNNGSFKALNEKKSAARLIGNVLNGAVPKIQSLNPDLILIAISKDSGLVESRKSLYNTIISWLLKRTSFLYCSEWQENKFRYFKVIAKKIPKDSDLIKFESLVKAKE